MPSDMTDWHAEGIVVSISDDYDDVQMRKEQGVIRSVNGPHCNVYGQRRKIKKKIEQIFFFSKNF